MRKPDCVAHRERDDSNTDKERARILLFVRLPEMGKVKTRLARAIGSEATVALYRCLVSDSLAVARQAGYPTTIFFHPPERQQEVSEWLGNELPCLPQMGSNLGERMHAAFRTAFVDCQKAVLIGSDIPDLPLSSLHEAFESLDSNDAVIGPSRDGGYYLVGFSSQAIPPALFAAVEEGTPFVFDRSMEVLTRSGLKVRVLPPWQDIDEYADLRAFFRAHRDAPECTLATMDFLRRHLGWR